MNGKRLYRSESSRMLCGVCAGIAEYFNLDPTIIRLAWALFCILGGSGVRLGCTGSHGCCGHHHPARKPGLTSKGSDRHERKR